MEKGWLYIDEYIQIKEGTIVGVIGDCKRVNQLKANLIQHKFLSIGKLPDVADERTTMEYLSKDFIGKEAKIETELGSMGLTNIKQKYLNMLSASEFKKVSLVYSTLFKPKLVIIERPREGLDNIEKDVYLALLININLRGQTLLFITDDQYFLSFCSQIFELK
ncbi:MAG: hypothetical protein ACRC0V_04605 [Fusobacteriaceae bacterium]